MQYLKRIATADQAGRRAAIEAILREQGLPCRPAPFEQGVNIVVPCADSGPRLVLGAHWDSVPGSTGANDDGAACAVLLRLAAALRGVRGDVEFVFFDREEQGQTGSAAYIRETGARSIRAMLNLDVCGSGTRIVISEKGNAGSALFGRALLPETLERHGADLLAFLPNGDDRSFDDAGIPNVSIAVLEEDDAAFFRRVSEKIRRDIPIADEEQEEFTALRVLKTMHNAENDSIACVSQEAMDRLLRYLLDALG